MNIGFHFLRAFAWPAGPNTAEAFSFDDPRAKDSWRSVRRALSSAPGVVEVASAVTDATLDVFYNGEATPRESIVSIFTANGFVLEPETAELSSAGGRIVIPPNQVV